MRIGWPRIRTSLLVLSSAAVALAVLVAIAYRTGSACDTETAFLATFRSPSVDEMFLATVGEEALSGTDYNDVVFVGDSTCRHGIDPLLFERLSGLSAYNLGVTIHCGGSGILVIGKAYLSRHPKPKAMVFCVTPAGLAIPPDLTPGGLEYRILATYGARVEGLPPDLIVNQSWLESCRMGLVLNFRALSPLSQDPNGNPTVVDLGNYRANQKRARETHGYYALKNRRPPAAQFLQVEPDRQKSVIDPSWTRSVWLLAQACESAGVRFIVRLEPIWSNYREQLDSDRVEAWLREIERNCKGATVCRPALLWYDTESFYDEVHLNTVGVDRFMQVLAKDVRGALDKKPAGTK